MCYRCHEFGKARWPSSHVVRGAEDVLSNKDAFSQAEAMGRQGLPLPRDLTYSFLQTSIENKKMGSAQRAHALMLSSRDEYVSVLDDRLIHLFALCGSLLEADLVFCLVEKPSCHTWHAIISAHASLGCNNTVLQLFDQMQCKGVKPSRVTFLCMLKVCAIVTAFARTLLIHGLIINSKFESDVAVGNALLDTYAKCGSLMDACCVFENLKNKDTISNNAMITAYVQHEQHLSALECLGRMLEVGIEVNEITYSCIFRACGALEASEQGRLIHAKLIGSNAALDVVINNTLIDMYARCGSLEDAHKIFDGFSSRDVVSWGSMIAGCILNGQDFFALELYGKMQQAGVTPDRISFLSVLQACGRLRAVGQGMLLHALVLRHNFEVDAVMGSTLVDMYARCACFEEALKVFQTSKGQNVNSWNAMIAGYVQHEHPALAIQFFERMQRNCIKCDELTCTWIMKACGSVHASKQGHWLHDIVVRSGLESKELIETSLIDMYVELENLEGAQAVFKQSSSPRCLHTRNTVIAEHAYLEQPVATSTNLDEKMQGKSLIVKDEFTFSSIAKACSAITAVKEGNMLHDKIIRLGVDYDVVIGNSLISMYSECGDLIGAEKVFTRLSGKDIVSWNSMIIGYTRHGFDVPAIELFEELQQANQSPDSVTFLSILKACGNIGSLEQGKIIHDLIIRRRIGDNLAVDSALVDMYTKCGGLYCARKVFDNMPRQNVITWGALAHGYSLYGCLASCEQCLEDMQGARLKPDGRIFGSILAACSHAGLVEEGRHHFKAMQEVYGLTPTMEDCYCMIDLLCRAGCLTEAKELLCSLPISPNIYGWMSLFTACEMYGNRELARLCFDHAIHLDPDMAGAYIALLNVSADCLLWDNDVNDVQHPWKSMGATKEITLVGIEGDCRIDEFAVLYNELQAWRVLPANSVFPKREFKYCGHISQLHPFSPASRPVGKEHKSSNK